MVHRRGYDQEEISEMLKTYDMDANEEEEVVEDFHKSDSFTNLRLGPTPSPRRSPAPSARGGFDGDAFASPPITKDDLVVFVAFLPIV